MSKFRILIVEDELLLRQALAALLDGAGYEVTQAISGEEALRLASQSAPAAVTINYELPDMNGLALAEKLRRLPYLEGIPLLLITSLEFPGNCSETPLPHVNGYLNKKDLIDYLLPCMQQYLGTEEQPPQTCAQNTGDHSAG